MRPALLVAAAAFAIACRRDEGETASSRMVVASVPASSGLANVATSLRPLRWIEGTWRGHPTTGTPGSVFYERYRLVNDSTLNVENSSDSTFAKSKNTHVQLRSGIGLSVLDDESDEPVTWILSAIGSDSARFTPDPNAKNSFSWRRIDDHQWIARVEPTDSGHPVTEYLMERLSK